MLVKKSADKIAVFWGLKLFQIIQPFLSFFSIRATDGFIQRNAFLPIW
jgi:hypothetical protein